MGRNEPEIKKLLVEFIEKAISIIEKLSAEKMIEESAINPLLAKALGLNDFNSLAKFYVYQRVGRGLVTSFGTSIEKLVNLIIGGEKGTWWDIVKKTKRVNYYISVKSGPRDMNKDQVVEFSRRAKLIMKEDRKAYPLIAMGYGKKVWSVIPSTLKSQGLDPKKHALAEKRLYKVLTGEADYGTKLLKLIVVQSKVSSKGTVVDVLEKKVITIAHDFKRKYRNVDELLNDTF